MEKSPEGQTLDLIMIAGRYRDATAAQETARKALLENLPELLVGARQAANRMSQQDLGDRIGVGATVISKIENGVQVPGLETLEKIVVVLAKEALGVPGPLSQQYESEVLAVIGLMAAEHQELLEPLDGQQRGRVAEVS